MLSKLKRSYLTIPLVGVWLIICTGILLVFSSCTTKVDNSFVLNGNIKGMDGNKAVLIVSDKPGSADTLGQVVVQNGHFQISGKLEAPVYAYINFTSPKYYSSFWIGPGSVEINLDTSQIVEGRANVLQPIIKGSKEQELYEKFNQNYKVIYADLNSAYNSFKQTSDPIEKKKLEVKVDSLREEAQKKMSIKIFDFVRKNNSSVVSAYLMRGEINDNFHSVDTLEAILSNFTEDVKKSKYYKAIREALDVLKRIQPGKAAPDFTLPDPQDNKLSLSSLKGKVVLIDFWASWCKPCIASIPDMKQIYTEYKNKGFEILGVSDDSKKEAWLNSLKENSVPWQNVIDEFPKPPEPFGPAKTGVLYGIHYLPTTILLDRNGIIVAKNLHTKELEENIKEIL